MASAWRVKLASVIAQQGACSYALFLVHFPVLMLANALFIGLGKSQAAQAVAQLLLAWLVSTGTALAFYRLVKQSLTRLTQILLRHSPPAATDTDGPSKSRVR